MGNFNKKKIFKVNFRFSSILIFIILSFVCFNNTAWAQKNHILKGTITDIPVETSKLVYLYLYFGDELSVFTSASIDKQGGFSIELDETLKQGM